MKSFSQVGLPIFLTGLVILVGGVVLNSWPHILGFDQPDSTFYDLQVLLFQADQMTNRIDLAVYAADPSSTYLPNYPSLVPWILSLMSIGMGALFPFGISLVLIFSAAIAIFWSWTLNEKERGEKLLSTTLALFLVFSPPTILAFERGNYDLAVFVAASMALALSTRYPFISSAMLSLTALMKLFPLGLVLMFATQKKRFMLISIPILSLLTYSIFRFEELAYVSKNTPRPQSAAFGQFVPAGEVAVHTELSTIELAAIWLGFHAFVALTYFQVFRKASGLLNSRDVAKKLLESSLATNLVIGGTGLLLLVYLVGNSYDYRLIFVLFPVMGLAKVLSLTSKPMILVWVLALVTSYFAFTSGPMALLGDYTLALLLFYMSHLSLTLIAKAKGKLSKRWELGG